MTLGMLWHVPLSKPGELSSLECVIVNTLKRKALIHAMVLISLPA